MVDTLFQEHPSFYRGRLAKGSTAGYVAGIRKDGVNVICAGPTNNSELRQNQTGVYR